MHQAQRPGRAVSLFAIWVVGGCAWALQALLEAYTEASAAPHMRTSAATTGQFLRAVALEIVSHRMRLAALGHGVLVGTVASFFVLTRGCLERGLTREDQIAVQGRLVNFSLFKLVIVYSVLQPLFAVELALAAAWFAVVALLDVLGTLVRRRLEASAASQGRSATAHSGYVFLLALVLGCNALLAVASALVLLPDDANLWLLLVVDNANIGM